MPEPIAQPAKEDAAPVAAPTRKKLVMIPIQSVRRSGPTSSSRADFLNERKQAHFEAIEEPTEQGGGEGHPLAEVAGAGGCVVHAESISIPGPRNCAPDTGSRPMSETTHPAPYPVRSPQSCPLELVHRR